jgi:hypothetical protein
MIKGAHWIGIEREGHDSASRGPKPTFFCRTCGQLRMIVGRGKLVKGGPWCCAICLAKSQEST